MTAKKADEPPNFNAISSSLGIPPTVSESPPKKSTNKKKKKKQEPEAKLQFPLLMKDDALDDLLKEMTGKNVSVYGEDRTPSPTRSRKDKAPQLKGRL